MPASATIERFRLTFLELLVAAAYIAAGKLGLMLATVHPSATTVWAPTGISLAAFILLGQRIWPGVFLGAFVVNATTEGSMLTSLAIAVGNTLEGSIGGYLVTRFAGGAEFFKRTKNVFSFAILGALVAPIASATIGVTALAWTAFAPWDLYGTIWFTWWVGDAVGAILVTPLILTWLKTPWNTRWAFPHMLELGALLLTTVGVSVLAFGGLLGNASNLAYLCIPPIIWAACRFDPKTTSTLTVMISVFAILAATIRGTEHVAGATGDPLALLQAFMGIISITGLGLAAAVQEHQSAEGALRRSESSFRLLVERSFDAIVRLDKDGIILSATPSITRILGFPLETLLGKQLQSYIHPDDQEIVRSLTSSVISMPGGSIQAEFRLLHNDLTWRWVETNMTNLIAVPDVQAIVCNVRDITERKREEHVQGQFSTLASHQLRTPLATVRWFLEDLRKTPGAIADPEQREALTMAELAAQRMADAIHAMLTLARIEAGRTLIATQNVAVLECLQKVCSDVQDDLRLREHQSLSEVRSIPAAIVIACADDLHVQTHPELLREAVGVLIRNAIQFSPAGAPVRVSATPTPGGGVRITVEDQGSGIAPHDRSGIFSMFFRGQNAEQGEGNGLGLYLAYTIARTLGGNLWYETHEGGGTTFILSLQSLSPYRLSHEVTRRTPSMHTAAEPLTQAAA